MQNTVANVCTGESRMNPLRTATDTQFSEWCFHPLLSFYVLLHPPQQCGSGRWDFLEKVRVGVEEGEPEAREGWREGGREGGLDSIRTD